MKATMTEITLTCTTDPKWKAPVQIPTRYWRAIKAEAKRRKVSVDIAFSEAMGNLFKKAAT